MFYWQPYIIIKNKNPKGFKIPNLNFNYFMKKTLILSTIFLFAFNLRAQKYITNNGFIELSGEVPFEYIKAENIIVESILDPNTGVVKFKTLMKSFHFKLVEFEEPFNKNFIESDKYPISEFKGIITNIENINFNKAGSYKILVEGNLTIHNVMRKVTHSGIIEVTSEGIIASSKFKLKPEDYNIDLPTIFGKKLAKEIKMTVKMNYIHMKNNVGLVNASIIK